MKERNNKVRDEMEMKRRKLIEKEKRGEKKRNNGEEKGTKDGRWWEGKRKDVIK